MSDRPIYIHGFTRQLRDLEPIETQEWLESLDEIIQIDGDTRARYLSAHLLERAREHNIGVPGSVSTPYINTIPPEAEPAFPGDEHLEKRIRRFIRWNAAAMVIRANRKADGIGGHLSTFASSATLYEIGFNHFFRDTHPERDTRTDRCGDRLHEGSSRSDRPIRGETLHDSRNRRLRQSGTREALRSLFEVDTAHIVVAVLTSLMNQQAIGADMVTTAIERYDIDPDAPAPWTV